MRKFVWGVPAALWLVFTLWYTDLGGPLTEAEVAEAMAYLDDRGIDSEFREKMKTFLENDTGRQFLMVNNIDMSEAPPRMEGFGPDATAGDYMNHYMEHMYPELFSRASHPIFLGAAQGITLDVSGIEGAEVWDSAALFRYRSRRTFLEIVTNPAIGPRHDFKLAALTKTIAYPVEAQLYMSDPRLLLFLVAALLTTVLDILIFGRRRESRTGFLRGER